MLINMGTDYPKKAESLSSLALSVVPEPTAPVFLGNLPEIQILRPYSRTIQSEILA